MTGSFASLSSGERVRFLRRDKNLTMAEVSSQIGISRTYLWQIETSDHIPSFEIARSLANLLGTTLDEIWPEFRQDRGSVTSPDTFTEDEIRENKMDSDEHETDLDQLIWQLFTTRASINLRRSRYAETMYPLIDYGYAVGIVDEFTELLRKWKRDEVVHYLLLAVDAESRGNLREAVEAYKHARERVVDAEVIALIDWNLGNIYRELYEYHEAIHYLDQALGPLMSRSRIKPSDLAGIETTLGWLHYRAGNYKTAETHFNGAIDLWREIEEYNPASEDSYLAAYRGLGSTFERQGNFQGAADCLMKVIEEGNRNRDYFEVTWGFSRLGFLHIHSGDWENAMQEMEKGFNLSKDLIKTAQNPRSLEILQEIILNNQGLLSIRMGDYETAMDFSRQALDRAYELNDHRGEAFCHMFTSLAYVALENWDHALKHARLAERQFEEMDIRYYLPEVYCIQAEILLRTIGSNGAFSVAEEALMLATKTDSKSIYQEAIALRTIGKVRAQLGERAEAKKSLLRSIEILNEVNEPYDLAMSYLALAVFLYEIENDRVEALTQIECAKTYADQLGAKGILQQVEKLTQNLNPVVEE